MKRLALAMLLVAAAVALVGCGHAEKIAPCWPSEGLGAAFADPCGPLRRINAVSDVLTP